MIFNLTNKQIENGEFLGLLTSLGVPSISSLIGSLMGKWLQIDRPRQGNALKVCAWTPGSGLQIDLVSRSYRNIPIVDIIKWVKYFKIKNFNDVLMEISL